VLAFSIGACGALGGDIMLDAFGIVAMVAMTPLLAVQALGLFAVARQRAEARRQAESGAKPETAPDIVDLDG